ncbi:cytidine/deoxycytidylate deaminase family protein [Clostridium saccharoperbutylacetonicum]
MNDYIEGIEKVFSERKNFMVIGLTGRTGAGTSTAAKILTKKIEELGLSEVNELKSNEDRKKRIVHNFSKVNWQPFKIIEVRNIITSFILEENYEKFLCFVRDKLEMKDCNNYMIYNNLIENHNLKKEFDNMHARRIDIRSRLETDYTSGKYEQSLAEPDIYDFYFEMLPAFTELLKNEFTMLHKNLYYNLFQTMGRNIRKSGSAYDYMFKADNIYLMPQRINKMIKILRKRNYIEKTGVRVVIDSLKNPYEIQFFKDRYSSFYSFAIHTNEENRRNRLMDNINLSPNDIRKIDENEYNEKIKYEDEFYSQSIPSCFQIADIHINNPENSIGKQKFENLKRDLIKYVSLIMHPGIISPTHIERCMNIAYSSKVNSGCLSRNVGAVVTDKNFSVLSIGWNSTPEGQVDCKMRSMESLISCEDNDEFSNYELSNEFKSRIEEKYNKHVKGKIFNGVPLTFCFKDIYAKNNQVHTRSLHAEENAFLQLIKNGIQNNEERKLFTTASPCVLCSKKAYHLGIKEIYYIDHYSDIGEIHILQQGDEERRPKMIQFTGAIGNAYFKLFDPIMPMKDEMYLLSEMTFE